MLPGSLDTHEQPGVLRASACAWSAQRADVCVNMLARLYLPACLPACCCQAANAKRGMEMGGYGGAPQPKKRKSKKGDDSDPDEVRWWCWHVRCTVPSCCLPRGCGSVFPGMQQGLWLSCPCVNAAAPLGLHCLGHTSAECRPLQGLHTPHTQPHTTHTDFHTRPSTHTRLLTCLPSACLLPTV